MVQMVMIFVGAFLPNGVHPQILQFWDKIANPFILLNNNFLGFVVE